MSVKSIPCSIAPSVRVQTQREPTAEGVFAPSWDSLEQYAVPEWFRDAKFGIWAHWGPQCQPEAGDWYARHMYLPGQRQYEDHRSRYGHPSQRGFLDIIHEWQADAWNPGELLSLYKRAGAKYFFAMANHHDNLDLWASRYHEWNSVRVGPRKDIVRGWADAARAAGMPFGVSVHASHAWIWYEPAQGADATGPHAGVSYDGKRRAADGAGTWWQGLDPQALYAQNHPPCDGFMDADSIHARWNWGSGAVLPDAAYCQAFHDRTLDLINQFDPELLYFDDTALPLWPVSDAGLNIAAHFYNRNLAKRRDNGVLFGKILDERQMRCMTWDIERGQSSRIEPLPWQTDTCIGGWHYDREVYANDRYKSAADVLRMLVDVVSKNGNLLLSVPVRGNGTIDEKERAIIEQIAGWMQTHSEAIFETRPWQVCGEGPQLRAAPPLNGQGFNEGRGLPFTADDIRYTCRGETIYAFAMASPTRSVTLEAIGRVRVRAVEQLGVGPVEHQMLNGALEVVPRPDVQANSDLPVAFRITPGI